MDYSEKINKTLTSIANHSRVDFTFNIFHHPKGQWLQYVLKPSIIRAIGWLHRKIETQYDRNAYKFDDHRLLALKQFFYEFGNKNFTYLNGRKHYHQSVDMLLFLLKEDIYYRSRFFKIWNEMHEQPMFYLDSLELQNLEKWK